MIILAKGMEKKMRSTHLLCCFLLCLPAVYLQDATSAVGQTQKPEMPQVQTDFRRQVHSAQIHNAPAGQITHQLATTSGDVYLHTTEIPPLIVQLDPLSTLWNLTCETDLVVVGKIGSGTSHPTMDQSYIYTDWDLVVGQIFKNNAKSPVQVGQTILVTRPGGTLEISGRHVYASREDFPQFQPNQEVLLYLRHLPPVGTYSLSSPNGFLLSDSKTIALDKARFGQFGGMQKSEILDLAQKAAIEKCTTGGQR